MKFFIFVIYHVKFTHKFSVVCQRGWKYWKNLACRNEKCASHRMKWKMFPHSIFHKLTQYYYQYNFLTFNLINFLYVIIVLIAALIPTFLQYFYFVLANISTCNICHFLNLLVATKCKNTSVKHISAALSFFRSPAHLKISKTNS